MKKSTKLLLPILTIASLSTSIIPMVSCGCEWQRIRKNDEIEIQCGSTWISGGCIFYDGRIGTFW